MQLSELSLTSPSHHQRTQLLLQDHLQQQLPVSEYNIWKPKISKDKPECGNTVKLKEG